MGTPCFDNLFLFYYNITVFFYHFSVFRYAKTGYSTQRAKKAGEEQTTEEKLRNGIPERGTVFNEKFRNFP